MGVHAAAQVDPASVVKADLDSWEVVDPGDSDSCEGVGPGDSESLEEAGPDDSAWEEAGQVGQVGPEVLHHEEPSTVRGELPAPLS